MIPLSALIPIVTKEQIYARALWIADKVGLPTTSWQPGDPTRSLYHVLAESLAILEKVASRYVASGFLDLAAALEDPKWLRLLAHQQYGYVAREATFAVATVRLTNEAGGLNVFAPGDITFRASTTGKTYRNTSGGTLEPWLGLPFPKPTLDVEVEAEEPGSESSAGVGEIDELVTNYLGVSVQNITAAVGLDAESNKSIVAGCRAKLMSLSPMGPAKAYEFVALNSDLTGTVNVTRCRVNAINPNGTVDVIIAGTGVATEDDRVAVENAVLRWATPLCITPSVRLATKLDVNVIASVYVHDRVNATDVDIIDKISRYLGSVVSDVPIGGNGSPGALHRALLIATIQKSFPEAIFDVKLSEPPSDLPVGDAYVPVLVGTTIVVVREAHP